MITLSEGINRTKARLANLQPQPLVVHGVALSPKAKGLVKDIEKIILGTEITTLAHFLYAEGTQQIILMQNNSGNCEAKEVMPKNFEAVTAAAACFGIKPKVGDGVIFFNPDFLLPLSAELRGQVIEHELWHIYLDRAFPDHGKELKVMDSSIPLFAPFFHHFLLRSAAIQAGRLYFAIEDARNELDWQLPRLEQKIRENMDEFVRFEWCMGVLFSTVLLFKVPQIKEDLGRSQVEMAEIAGNNNLAAIKKLFERNGLEDCYEKYGKWFLDKALYGGRIIMTGFPLTHLEWLDG